MCDRRRALPGLNAKRDVPRCTIEPGLFSVELEAAIDARKHKKRLALPHCKDAKGDPLIGGA